MQYDILDSAILFAVEAHKGQLRKDGTTFILHPLEDAAIVGTMTTDPEILAAAVLHDTVEDTAATPQQIREIFGERIYYLVMHETENKRPAIPAAATWQIRKEESLQSLASSNDPAVKMLWLGDKLSNIRAFYRQYITQGEIIFERFNNKDPKAHAWYYGTILDLLRDLSGYPAYKEYSMLFHKVFDNYL
ncbi:MAG: bifunctional (p)ppGpp synthetase/guanosine-3',5'-bis(diphosphate) 3'-pyrophosphohydrolase [Clostridia bacterium]|nr:bifunctional (p)ppGpp synthetase/guanosine-3',5'-bis(diphosphate) 3'-pyrophosphohydrolase [Clostridia bacterium]